MRGWWGRTKEERVVVYFEEPFRLVGFVRGDPHNHTPDLLPYIAAGLAIAHYLRLSIFRLRLNMKRRVLYKFESR